MWNTSVLSLLVLLFISSPVVVVDGFSTAAGGCDGEGLAAVGGYHKNTDNGRPVDANTLEIAGVIVTIGGIRLTTVYTNVSAAPTTKLSFPVGQVLDVSVSASQIPFLGFLIRVQPPGGIDGSGTLEPIDADTTQNAEVCVTPVQGITHKNNLPKLLINGTIRFDEPINDVIIDVTIVFTNGAPASIYAYTGYKVNFVAAEPGTPTGAPIAATTSTPTIANGTVPSTAPIAATTSTPTIANATVPSVTPTAPLSPTAAPVAGETPTGVPSDVPSSGPTKVQEFLEPTFKPSDQVTETPFGTISSVPSSSPKEGTSSPSIVDLSLSPTGSLSKRPVSSPPTPSDGSRPPMYLGLSTKRPSRHPTRQPGDGGVDKMVKSKKQKKEKSAKDGKNRHKEKPGDEDDGSSIIFSKKKSNKDDASDETVHKSKLTKVAKKKRENEGEDNSKGKGKGKGKEKVKGGSARLVRERR